VRLLLDTHAFLWWAADHRALRAAARRSIRDADEVRVSAASAWEAAIKAALGRLSMDETFEEAVRASGFIALPITFAHAAAAGALPPHHADPFDRMLIAQAAVEGLTIMTRDRWFEPYDVPVIPT
jgi:PIN domain nuclease of toxin-antitoxin system